jgi:small multidrug resistance pump
MKGYLFLVIAIIAEVTATTAMKALSNDFTKIIPLTVVIVGYAIAFGMLTLVVRTVPVGIAYAIWAGFGIVFVSIAAYFIYNQKLDIPAMIGIALIVLGAVIMQVFSKTVGH